MRRFHQRAFCIAGVAFACMGFYISQMLTVGRVVHEEANVLLAAEAAIVARAPAPAAVAVKSAPWIQDYYAVDGCPSTGSSLPTELRPANSHAVVRCCVNDGTACYSKQVGCLQDRTLAQAMEACAEHGQRLCTKGELEKGVCCRTGCGFDSSLAWSSTGEASWVGNWTPLLLSQAEGQIDHMIKNMASIDSLDAGKIPVWVWWEFPSGVPTAYRLNVRTWLRHMPAKIFQLKFVDSVSIRKYYPDLPVEFARLYQQARSDFLRASMLALHGGIYLDGDMLLREDVQIIFKDVFWGDVDIMVYLWETQECRRSFSTNFIAGKRGNPLSRGWLSRILSGLASRCPTSVKPHDNGAGNPYDRKVCCYTPSGNPRQCYVSFGMIGDNLAHATIREADEVRKSKGDSAAPYIAMGCIPKTLGMADNRSGSGGDLLWHQLRPVPPQGWQERHMKWSDIPKIHRETEPCWHSGAADLQCEWGGRYPGFFGRYGFHLFNVLNGHMLKGFRTEQDIMDSGTIVGDIYRRSLKGEDVSDPRHEQLRLKHYPVGA
eukprot:CAMPEP_0172891072 /NCGR_PEP_ID=MMETSP1075-20121228/142933_1 /TAXON_ID=2916 /ORGANISM="Ceratium fusus, Strain PA161109" /LENGTH=544 /DNA_ID=CAMNT_0013745465 /DNA_START=18 /DNA_END=1649 /DNA_ORIENTATION=-